MKYITITAKTYEEALKKARDQYSDKIRIHSRKDYSKPGFLGLIKHRRCELTCFISEKENTDNSEEAVLLTRFEQEAQTPSPKDGKKNSNEPKSDKTANTDEKINQLLAHSQKLLDLNEFSKDFSEKITAELSEELRKALPDIPGIEQFELLVLDKIAGLFEIDFASQANPPKFTVVLGTTGTGKTTTTAKISALYSSFASGKREVKIISLDSYRIGAFEQIESFGKNLGINVLRASDGQEFKDCIDSCTDTDLVIVDTMGKSPKDKILEKKLSDLLENCPADKTGYYVAVSASMKPNDIEKALEQFENYPVRSVIITKVDETEAVGNVLSVCSRKNLPVLFVTDGQKVPSNIHRASTSYLMTLLNGFSADITKIK